MTFPQDKKASFKAWDIVIKDYRIFKGKFNIRMFNLDRFNSFSSSRWNLNLIHYPGSSQHIFLLYQPLTIYLDKR